MDTESLKQKVRGFLGSTSNLISPIKDHDLKDLVSHNHYWKIHDSIKKTTNQECSVFIFEKKSTTIPKSNVENIIGFLRKEATTLQRLRHPSVLQVVSVLEETKTHLYFATEPILATLEDLINDHRKRKSSTVDSSSTSEEGYKKKDFTFEELEVKSGIFQVLDGLLFLNATAKLLHRNISPESIYITKSLKWKLGGLGFTCSIETKEPPISNLSLNDLKEYLYQESFNILPQLDYLPPEFVNQRTFLTNSDLYAVGRLILEMVLNLDNQAIESHLKSQLAKLGVVSYYNTMLDQARRQASLNTQKYDSAKVCTILLGDASLRGDLDNFIRSSYFNDTLTKTIVYLQNITQKEEDSKIRFYRGLLGIVQQFSSRIQNNYILPVLLSEVTNDRITYVLLPCIMSICNNHVKKETFQSKILPSIAHILTSKEPKAEVLTCILDNLSLFITKGSIDSVKRYLIPIILGTLCGPTQEIIFQALSFGQQTLKFFDSETLQSGLIPRLTNLCVGGFPVHIRTKAINWFTAIVPSMEKQTIVDSLIPNLEKILSGDNSPAILEALVQTYDAISKKLGGELLALKVLPALIPLSSDKHLDLQQFKTIMKVIREILNAYESERSNELSNLQRYTKPEVAENNMFTSSSSSSSSSSTTTTATTSTISPVSITLPSNFEQQLNNNKNDPFASLNSNTSAISSTPIASTTAKNDPFASLSSSSSTTTTNNDPFGSLSPSSGITSGTNDKSLLSSPDFGSFNRNSNTSPSSINITLPPPAKPKSPLNNSSNLNKSSNNSIMNNSFNNNNNNNNNNNSNNNNSYNSTVSSLNNLNINSSSIKPQNSIFDFDGNNNSSTLSPLKPNNATTSNSSSKSRYDINLDNFTNSNSNSNTTASTSLSYNSQINNNNNNYSSSNNNSFTQQNYNTSNFDQVLKPSSNTSTSNQTLSYNSDLSFNSSLDNSNNSNYNNNNNNNSFNYNNSNSVNSMNNSFYNNNNNMMMNNNSFYNNNNNTMMTNNQNNNDFNTFNNNNSAYNNNNIYNNNNNLYNNSKFSNNNNNTNNNNNNNNNNFW